MSYPLLPLPGEIEGILGRARRRRWSSAASAAASALVLVAAFSVVSGPGPTGPVDRLENNPAVSTSAPTSAPGGARTVPVQSPEPAPLAESFPATPTPGRRVAPAGPPNAAAGEGTVAAPVAPAARPAKPPMSSTVARGLRECDPFTSEDLDEYCFGYSATRAGEGVLLSAWVCNRYDVLGTTVRYRSSLFADLAVTSGDRTVWRWSAGQSFEPGWVSVYVPRGDCHVNSVTWNVAYDDGRGAGRGRFRLWFTSYAELFGPRGATGSTYVTVG